MALMQYRLTETESVSRNEPGMSVRRGCKTFYFDVCKAFEPGLLPISRKPR